MSALYRKSLATEDRAVHQKQRRSSQEEQSIGAEHTQKKLPRWAEEAHSHLYHVQLLILCMKYAGLQCLEDSLQSETIFSKILQTGSAISIWPQPEPPHRRGHPGAQLPW